VVEAGVAGPGAWFLVSERLGFRTWQPDDLELAAALWGDPEVTRLIGGPLSREAAAARLAAEMATQAEAEIQYWPIFQLADGAHVGCCGLRPYRPAEAIHELGVHIRPPFWRRGLALEAARAVIAHAFAALGARALFAGHNPDNHASRAMLTRLGFRYSHDELYRPTGRLHPSYLLHPTADG
jgi:ribosomal-protein-alanine N-acetyltransferase